VAQKTGPLAAAVKKVPHISQGSVATRIRYFGMFVDDFIANLLLSLVVKELKIG